MSITAEPESDQDEWDEWCTDECPEDCMADHKGEQ